MSLSVLMVCTANICRSPYLEIQARALAGEGSPVTFSSAGTMGFSDHAMDETMAGTLPPGAADAFRSRPLTPAILSQVDLVLTAEREHRTRILEESPQFVRKVFTVGQFAAGVEANPDLRGAALVQAVGRKRIAPTSEQDISDPYRRGPEAAATAAVRIDALLRTIVPALVD
ncbi:MAG: hypothetical protein ACI379_06530 [Nocardioides sp.]|uniref:arsenate reductase/protein-tyrosine-phosphatase family protein n=1 Tax=Nocardioides sp. TaxID=35761 RepID=UPI003EFE78D7